MKKVGQSWSRDYGSLKIFRDDIEEIAGIITSGLEQKEGSEGWNNKLEFKAYGDGFAIDNLSELEKFKGNYLRNLSFMVGLYRFHLDLAPKWATLSVDNSDDTILMGIATRIDAILQKRRRLLGYLRTDIGYSFLGVLVGLFFFVPLFHNTYTSSPAFTILVLIIILDMVCVWYLNSHVSTICLRHSHDESNFFVRNKDAILVNMVTTIFGFLLGIAGTLFVQAILNKSKDKTPPATSQTMPKEVNEVSEKQPEK
jgi:hypothetical protein